MLQIWTVFDNYFLIIIKETEWYPRPLHKPMDGRSTFLGDDPSRMRNISLTAHVLVSLEATAPNLQVILIIFIN